MKEIIFYKGNAIQRVKFNPGKKIKEGHYTFLKVTDDNLAYQIIVPMKDGNGKMYTIPMKDIVDIEDTEYKKKKIRSSKIINPLTGA